MDLARSEGPVELSIAVVVLGQLSLLHALLTVKGLSRLGGSLKILLGMHRDVLKGDVMKVVEKGNGAWDKGLSASKAKVM